MDPWLCGVDNPFVISIPLVGLENLRVADLIDFEAKQWRVDIVGEIFQQIDKEAILNIPLLHLENDDKRLWKLSNDGQHSVRSAYYYIMERLIDNNLKVLGD